MEQDHTFINLQKHFAETDYFSMETFEHIISYFTVVTLKKKEYFTMQGSLCRYLGFVNAGCLRAFHTDEKGNEFTMYFAF